MSVSRLVAAASRQYSTHTSHNSDRVAGAIGYAMTGYLAGAFVLPFVPPYLASRRTQQDGSFQTRPPITYTYRPVF
ncbi:hypothetical protein BT63DRAFT_450702 [Microthyrium microscopicum]|uniref:Uncharacterized protein n=1 Tax=Microthyrium microscopicum TaxID=703497 RepID=A0A6A6UP48_9PEZI|nr:hypothetical protein BT63DRAFT_450702 [Microthyrium microscopicum]